MSTDTTAATPAPTPPMLDPKQVEKLIEVYNATAKKPPVGATIAAALAKVQGRLHSVKKDRDVEVETRTGGKYKFRYATLAAIWDVIRQPCAENGIAIVQFPTVDLKSNTITVETRVMHESGEFLVNTCVLPLARTDAQGIGAIITYARRYSLSALMGVTQEDGENEEEELARQRDDYSQLPPPMSTQRPAARQQALATTTAKSSATQAAKTDAKTTPPPPADVPPPTDGEPPSEGDLEMQLTSCSTLDELKKAAARVETSVKAGAIDAAARARLLSVYKACAEVLKGTAK